jgi:lysozyme
MYDLNKFIAGVKNYITSHTNDSQRAAIVSFAYNVGLGALLKSTLLKKVNANPNDPTIADEFERWDMAGGKHVKGILRRRRSESWLYSYGELKFDFD